MSTPAWNDIIDFVEDERGYDLPRSLKQDAARVCEHLWRQNPERGRFDAKYSLNKVSTYLYQTFEKFEAMRAEMQARPIPRKDH